MWRFHVVHNIPSPYRLHLFTQLDREVRLRGGELHVHFLAKNHRDRPKAWEREPASLPFSASLSRDIGPVLGGRELHVNPALFMALRRARPTVLMVGGPWDTPSTMLASALPVGRLRVAWYEPNTRTPGRTRGPLATLKRALLSRFDLIAVPGSDGARFTHDLLGVSTPTVILPNLVDETLFQNVTDAEAESARCELGVGPAERLALLPARLAPEKGIVELLDVLDRERLAGWQLRIVGEGPLAETIARRIVQRGLENLVKVLGYVPYARMPALYRAADLFVLPSLYDPNPLSVVEALHSGLPLFVSRRTGNLPEALREGENGYSFEPGHRESMASAVGAAFGANREELAAMGKTSLEQARFWQTKRAVGRFLDTIEESLRGLE